MDHPGPQGRPRSAPASPGHGLRGALPLAAPLAQVAELRAALREAAQCPGPNPAFNIVFNLQELPDAEPSAGVQSHQALDALLLHPLTVAYPPHM